MRKFLPYGMLLILVGLFMATWTYASNNTPPALVLYENDAIRLIGGDGCTLEQINEKPITYLCSKDTTPTPLPTATATTTPTPTPTITPTPGNVVEPYPNAPQCAENPPTDVFHTIWNETLGCHYDHAHGEPEPPYVNEIWGDWTQYTEGQEIGYVWQTPGENTLKHPGYNWGGFDYRDRQCGQFLPGTGGISAWRIQAHGMGNITGVTARIHSFFGMAQLCDPATDEAGGTIIVGGHQDFGWVHTPYKERLIPTELYEKAPSRTYGLDAPPYVGMASNRFDFETWNSGVRRISETAVNEHKLFRFGFRILDPRHFYDGDFNLIEIPGNDSSRHSFYQLEITIPAELAGPDGRVNFTGFVDVEGNIDTSCTEASEDCAPLVIEDAVPGFYSVNANRNYGLPLRSGYESDILFDGQPSGWIGPMN